MHGNKFACTCNFLLTNTKKCWMENNATVGAVVSIFLSYKWRFDWQVSDGAWLIFVATVCLTPMTSLCVDTVVCGLLWLSGLTNMYEFHTHTITIVTNYFFFHSLLCYSLSSHHCIRAYIYNDSIICWLMTRSTDFKGLYYHTYLWDL